MTLDIWSENSSRCTLKTSWLYFVLSNTPLKLRNVSRKVAGSGVISILSMMFVFSGAELQFILLCLAKSFSYAICIYLIGTRAQYKFRTVNYEQNNCISHKGSSFFSYFRYFLSVLNDIEISLWDVQGHFGAWMHLLWTMKGIKKNSVHSILHWAIVITNQVNLMCCYDFKSDCMWHLQC